MRSKFQIPKPGKQRSPRDVSRSQALSIKFAGNELDASPPVDKTVTHTAPAPAWSIAALHAQLKIPPQLATAQRGEAPGATRDMGNIFVADAPIAVAGTPPHRPPMSPVRPMLSVPDNLLRDSRQWLHHALKAAKLTYVEIDYVGKRILRPENFADVMGFAAHRSDALDLETSSSSLIAHVIPGDRQRVRAAVQDFLTGRSSGRIEYSVTGDDGVERCIESIWSLEVGVDGRPVKAFATNLDISERALAQATLREANARYQSLFTSIDQGICIVEMIFSADGKPVDYRFIEVNPSFEKQSGLHNATGKRVRELVPELEAFWWERFGNVALTGEPVRVVHKVRSSGDRWFDVFAFRLGGPASRQLILTFTDITQRKRAEKVQRGNEAMFRATFEHAALGIAHVGLDSCWLRVNPALCRLTGYRADELIGKSIAEITHPDDVADSLETIRRQLAGETTSGTSGISGTSGSDIASGTREKRYIHKTGRHVTVALTVSLLRDAAGSPLYLIGVIEDISERNATLADLERKTRFVERLTHIMPNTLHVFDLASKRNLWINRHIGLMLGYSSQDIEDMGSRFVQLTLHPDDAIPLAAHFERVGASCDNEAFDFEYRMCNHEGEWRWMHQTDIVFRRNLVGEVTELVGTATDVTERTRGKADLKTALSIAEAANLTKSDFLSRMSHELRSPLNAVLGYAQLLESGTPQPTPIQRESIEHILKAGWYLLELINEVLDLAAIESGNLSFTPENVSLDEVLNDCQAMVELQAQKCGVRLTFSSGDGACLVRADRTRLQQVFVNLLSNAIKYNRPGGVVRVNCAVRPAGRLRVSFEDSGAGLTPHQMQQLFQPFERLGQEAGTIEGTGIGLVVSKRLVELMGGQIGAHSTVGTGSTFWVDLISVDLISVDPGPARDTPETGALAPDQMARGARQLTVLCVEDDTTNLMLVRRILERRADVRLIFARNANRGVAIARATRPDAILLDVNLPGIGVLDALELLSQNAATADIPVIAFSAGATSHDLDYAVQAGFFRYLAKPFKNGNLTQALDAALSRPASPAARSLVQVDSS